jgi:circadian clock protein KaiA
VADLSAPLSIAILADSIELAPLLERHLSASRHAWQCFVIPSEFLAYVESRQQELDCLVFNSETQLLPTLNRLRDCGIVLPLAIVQGSIAHSLTAIEKSGSARPTDGYIYQPSEVVLAAANLSELETAIDHAINRFLNLTPTILAVHDTTLTEVEIAPPEPNVLLQQQQRLADKLKERLGYLAVYYKRNPRYFFRHLDRDQKQELLAQLKAQYRKIVLEYFADSSHINATIDEFVSSVFFADLSVSEIVKIHMELMEEFSKQLKLEGRSEEILLDYRLTLIDIIAHLCEMYRRSVPRET